MRWGFLCSDGSTREQVSDLFGCSRTRGEGVAAQKRCPAVGHESSTKEQPGYQRRSTTPTYHPEVLTTRRGPPEPCDRGANHSLIASMDDATTRCRRPARAIDLYELTSPGRDEGMVAIAVEYQR